MDKEPLTQLGLVKEQSSGSSMQTTLKKNLTGGVKLSPIILWELCKNKSMYSWFGFTGSESFSYLGLPWISMGVECHLSPLGKPPKHTADTPFTQLLTLLQNNFRYSPFCVLSAYEVMKHFHMRKWHTKYLWKWFPHYWQLHPNHPEGLVKNSDSETEPSQSPEGTAWAYKLNKIPRQSWHVAKLGIYGKNPESRSLDDIQEGFLGRLTRGPPLQRLNVYLST